MFPSIFKSVGKKKQIAGYLGLDLLATDKLEKQIETAAKGLGKPESKRARKYLIQQLIARGYTRSEIADRLSVSRKTVYNILKSAL